MSGSYPQTFVYDDATFRAQCPAFADNGAYPEAMLSGYFTLGTDFISPDNWGRLRDGSRQAALYLMTAHIAYLTGPLVAGDGSTGVVISASIDKVRITIAPPPGKDAWRYWLNQSPYGQQLLALLSLMAVGGFYAGGRPELAAFRRGYGRFG